MIQLKRAGREDIRAMGELWSALVLEECPSACPHVSKWNRMQEDLIGLPSYYAFVAHENGNAVGFINGLILTDIETGETYVDGGHLFVLPQYRKSRAGALLHRKTYDVAKENGAKFLRRKVSTKNERMIRRMQKRMGTKYFIKEYVVDELMEGTL